MIRPKPAFEARIYKLLDAESKRFFEYLSKPPANFIRVNTIKMPTSELVNRLSEKWNILQPYSDCPEVIRVVSKLDGSQLGPGELGKAREHLLGYYYIQELSSMMPVIALNSSPKEFILDLCASPGSKTTQIAALMQNSGLLIANDNDLRRIIVLNANLERCGVTNTIVTREDSVNLCNKSVKMGLKFDKILLDAPCSGEGTRGSPESLKMWNLDMVKKFSRQQKRFLAAAASCLKEGGTLVYSTCTLAPEENEGVINFALENFPLEIKELNLPVKTREGVLEWGNNKFKQEVKKSCRIYPQDNDSEGFFIAKFVKKDD